MWIESRIACSASTRFPRIVTVRLFGILQDPTIRSDWYVPDATLPDRQVAWPNSPLGAELAPAALAVARRMAPTASIGTRRLRAFIAHLSTMGRSPLWSAAFG